ncbi:MAG: hypothetical protein ABFC80_03800 [Coriobacteriales bacterium]
MMPGLQALKMLRPLVLTHVSTGQRFEGDAAISEWRRMLEDTEELMDVELVDMEESGLVYRVTLLTADDELVSLTLRLS